ncbi:5247_t:CDS:2 [Diversispora eburnea]|uniref:5247_t:CDS:1 n=1 Tax=Diversispora eburnea TaxID=1213867 RepID=A0A9N8ZCP8_9GLOM|nr:5247_t:CDS:2 [Diversispora eburnea]
MVSLGEANLIIKLCVEEITSRGLNEFDIFRPVRNNDSEVRYLINCLLSDDVKEFADELRSQSINNIIAGIRYTLRNCSQPIITYENYEEFVRIEKGIFSKFLMTLSSHYVQNTLTNLFNLFSKLMLHSHENKIPTHRIIKSMSLCILAADKNYQTLKHQNYQTYQDFNIVYCDWLKYSDACMHMFLAFLRENACKYPLPSRLNMLLDGYVDFRSRAESFNNETFYHHPLADITIADLDMIIRPLARSMLKVDKNNGIINHNRNSMTIGEMFPEIIETLNSLKKSRNSHNLTIDDPNLASQKWEELMNKGSSLLSEEVLKLLLAFDDRELNPDATRAQSNKKLISHHENDSYNNLNQNNQTSSKRQSTFNQFLQVDTNNDEKANSRYSNNSTLERNDSGVSGVSTKSPLVWDDFEKGGFCEEVGHRSNILSLSSTLGATNLNQNNQVNHISRDLTLSVPVKTKGSRNFLCIKRRPGSEISIKHKGGINYKNIIKHNKKYLKEWYILGQQYKLSHLAIESIGNLFPYAWIESSGEVKESWGEWVLIEPREDMMNEWSEWIIIEDKVQFFTELEKRPKAVEALKRASVRNSIEFATNDIINGVLTNPRHNKQYSEIFTTKVRTTETSYTFTKPQSSSASSPSLIQNHPTDLLYIRVVAYANKNRKNRQVNRSNNYNMPIDLDQSNYPMPMTVNYSSTQQQKFYKPLNKKEQKEKKKGKFIKIY